MTAAGFLVAAPQFIPYDVLDLASGMHAVIVGWRAIASGVGVWIGPYVGFPDMPPEIVSGLVIGLSLGSFFGLGILRAEWGTHKGFIQNAAFWTRALIPLVSTPIMSLFFIVSYPTILFFFAAMYVLISLTTVLSRFQSFRHGFFAILGFVVFVEGVYIFSTERVRSIFDEFVCHRTNNVATRCQAEVE